MGAGGRIRIAAHIEIAWLGDEHAQRVCPNCRKTGPATQLLEIVYRPPDAAHHFILQICPHCTARFIDNPETMDYRSDELIEIGWNIYQVQLGAGLWPISAPLSRIDKPAGARVLEIGGAFGFGLDFCIRARGWRGEGYDPSPLAAFGARELELDIRQEYFGPAELARGPWDVVIATELVEHLADPPAFFGLMRAALAENGVLVLTTPDAEMITPGLDAAMLLPLLSPGAHLVLQTAASLRTALAAAGFAHVIVQRGAMSLIAYASAAPFALIEDAAASRAMYRNYLVGRGARTDIMSDMQLGYAGRAVFEAANDADLIAGEAAWQTLIPAIRQRFGIDLTTLGDPPDHIAQADLAALARAMPLGLGMILFGRAMHLSASGASRAALLPLFLHAQAAILRLQAALGQRSLRDALSDNIGEVLRAEILLCRAEDGAAETVDGLVALNDELVAWRGFVALVNAGCIGPAAALKTRMLASMPPADLAPDLHRNVLLSLANFVLAPGGESELAFDYAEALRKLGQPVDHIILAAFTRLVNASRYDAALQAAAAYGVDELAMRAEAGQAGRDARLARIVLDLSAGDPAAIPARLANLAIEPARRRALLLEAFIRLVNSARHAEALVFLREHDIPAMALRQNGVTGRDARLALIMLDLGAGDPAAIPGQLQGLEIPLAQRDDLLLQAFIRLVNASRYDAALEFARGHDIPALAAACETAARRDATLALIVLDLAAGDPAAIPARLQGLEIDPARRDMLLLQAFIRLVNASRHDEALAFIKDHDINELARTRLDEAGRDANLALMVLDFAVGDPAAIPARLAGLEIDSARRDVLLLQAFIRLVNASRYAEALAFIKDHGIQKLAQARIDAAGRDANLALMVLDLAVGDPAMIPGRLAGLPIDPGRRDILLLQAFIRLVNASRHAEAVAFVEAHDIPGLARAHHGEVGQDTWLALMVLDLAVGDPAVIPARLAGLEMAPARAGAWLLEAFIRLVNAARYHEAQGFLRDHDIEAHIAALGGEVGRDARLAGILLDLAIGDPAAIAGRLTGLDISPARRGALLLEAFIRLVNASRFVEAQAHAAAHDVPALMRDQAGAVGDDTVIALAVLDLAAGDPAQVPGRFTGRAAPLDRQTALVMAAFTGLVNQGRFAEAEAIAAGAFWFANLDARADAAARDARLAAAMLDLQSGRTTEAVNRLKALSAHKAPPAVLGPLTVDAFVRLVNAGNFAEARALAAWAPPEVHLPMCTTALRQDALAALVVMALQPGHAPARILALLAAARRGGLATERVEALALAGFVALVNNGDVAAAKSLWPAVEARIIRLRPPFDDAGCNVLFAAGVLSLQSRDDLRRAASLFARLRDGLLRRAQAGDGPDPLFWPALRGEIIALNRLNRGAEAMLLLKKLSDIYDDAPDDLRQQLVPVGA